MDRTTYEAWLLDRIEGNLTPDQEQELDAFLAANADLRADIGELPTVTDSGAGFSWKNELKKHYPPVGEPDAARIDDFLIARMEGTLDAERVKQLERLLYERPELQRNAELIAATKSGAITIPFQNKSSIVRHFPPQGMPDMHRLDDFLVARLEGDLTLQQRLAIDSLIAQDERVAKQWTAMQRTRVPQEPIVFGEKKQLKKRSARVIPISGSPWMKLAAAASIALLLGLGWLLLRNDEQVNGIAEQPEVVAPTVPKEQVQEQGQEQEQQGSGTNTVAAPAHEKSPVQGQKEQPVNSPQPERRELVPRQREEAPAMADVHRPAMERTNDAAQPVGVNVTPGLPPAPLDEALATNDLGDERQTIGELVAGTLRREVIGNSSPMPAPLNGSDVLAAVDKGLGTISGDRAGVALQRDQKRSRFRLHLGDLALSASTGR
ncbi:MAG: hypothetical protein ABI599_02370 [Flavobacteriales bacterium]